MNNKELIDKLNKEKELSHEEWVQLFETFTDEDRAYAGEIARGLSLERFGKKVYFRGIVEFSNRCKNDCLYCGIRRSNKNVRRYTLTKEEIMECCDMGYTLGYRTFVLQSGEGGDYTLDWMVDLIHSIKAAHPDVAVTLSLGEMEYEDYKKLREAGADRYLLRHETANKKHYEKLHNEGMSFEHRIQCLKWLKELGFQTGAGIMVGSPYQTSECLADDMIFMNDLKPEMIGIGPFLAHKDTPFKDEPAGSYELTLFLLSLCRIMLPDVLLPSTTALGTIRPDGREQGILAGANVIMPNMSPEDVRKEYMLYDNKICTDEKATVCSGCLKHMLKRIGYEADPGRGDFRKVSG